MEQGGNFARVYEEHASHVFHAAVRVLGDRGLAEDVSQEVFLALWRGGSYDETRGPVGPYLRLLARSRALDAWRKNRVGERTVARLEEGSRLDSPADEPGHIVQRAADREHIRARVRSLPADQRQAIGLAYWAGLTGQEAADVQGLALGTAKSRVRLGLRKLARDPALAPLGEISGVAAW